MYRAVKNGPPSATESTLEGFCGQGKHNATCDGRKPVVSLIQEAWLVCKLDLARRSLLGDLYHLIEQLVFIDRNTPLAVHPGGSTPLVHTSSFAGCVFPDQDQMTHIS